MLIFLAMSSSSSSSCLATHFTSFIFLLPLGIRRLLCSFNLYLINPSQFRSRTWFFSNLRWKNIDFFTLLIALPISSLSLIFFYLAFSGHPTYKFSFLQQSLVVFLFWVLLILVIIKENVVDPLVMPEQFLLIFAGISFLIEYIMNGKGIIGLGEVGYDLLGGLELVCATCCLYLSIRPSAFFADFVLSIGLLLKGTWVFQIGLCLYTDTFGFKGCEKVSVFSTLGKTDVKCALEEDRLRGIALMNLLFIGHVTVVLMVSFLVLGLVRHRQMRSGEGGESLLAQLDSTNMLMQPLPEFFIE